MKRRATGMFPIILMFIAVIAVFFLFISPFLGGGYSLHSDAQIKKDQKTLQAYQEANSAEDVSNKIATASYQIELQIRKENGLPIDNQLFFRRSALIGDSMSEGLVAYGLLDSANVFAAIGRRIKTSDAEIDAAIAFHPEHVFMQFGMNDLIYYRGDPAPFIADYEAMITKIRQALPNAHLYVIGIHPLQEHGMSATPSLRNYTAYNQAMKEMCERDDLTYVDTSILISASSTYEFDGLHPQEPFYSDWLDLMVMCLQKKEAES